MLCLSDSLEQAKEGKNNDDNNILQRVLPTVIDVELISRCLLQEAASILRPLQNTGINASFTLTSVSGRALINAQKILFFHKINDRNRPSLGENSYLYTIHRVKINVLIYSPRIFLTN